MALLQHNCDVEIYDLTDGSWGILKDNRAMEEALKSLGREYSYHEFSGGHSWQCWKDQLPGLLRYLYGAQDR